MGRVQGHVDGGYPSGSDQLDQSTQGDGGKGGICRGEVQCQGLLPRCCGGVGEGGILVQRGRYGKSVQAQERGNCPVRSELFVGIGCMSVGVWRYACGRYLCLHLSTSEAYWGASFAFDNLSTNLAQRSQCCI